MLFKQEDLKISSFQKLKKMTIDIVGERTFFKAKRNEKVKNFAERQSEDYQREKTKR